MKWTIEADQGLPTVRALHQKLSEALVPGAWIELDLSAVVTADFSFVQLIEAARCHADTVGARLSLCAPLPEHLLDLTRHAGLAANNRTFWTDGDITA